MNILPEGTDLLLLVRYKPTHDVYIVGRCLTPAGKLGRLCEKFPGLGRIISYIRVRDKRPFLAFENHFSPDRWEEISHE